MYLNVCQLKQPHKYEFDAKLKVFVLIKFKKKKSTMTQLLNYELTISKSVFFRGVGGGHVVLVLMRTVCCYEFTKLKSRKTM